MLIFVLPLGAGPVANGLLSQGVGFSGITLAVTAPDGDGTGALLEQLTGSMRDIRQYCTFASMTPEEAVQALERGEVTAILELPEDFIGGVMYGTNPDLTLILPSDKPLEGLLTLWVGQSAADMLTAAQRGVYAVLDLYPGQETTGLTWGQVQFDINFEYINLALGRTELFQSQSLQATGAMSIQEHYALSLLVFLALALSPLLLPLYDRESMAFRRRLMALGHGAPVQYFANLSVCFWVLLALTAVPGLYLTGGNWAGVLILALFSACYSSFCCVAVRSAAGSGGLSIFLSLGMTLLAGGVVPPVLLPNTLRKISALLPAQMLRSLLHLPSHDWEETQGTLLGIGIWSAALLVLGLLLYRHRICRQEVEA